ncbi:unnamed protein product [Bursaphelenchus xylophilus]|uniref:(pine wood nematode) hypothetical protein n=1 Tax=Bursaphelenchus xylophilus TaxID=6326 RepID=A0A1I7SW06_BURXY|nr:unnamed protein product [Bursaphelenchus xylophilus]CAG9098610.1 unnamed protein product [Bursaphelenchus xylophilus]
MGNKTVKYGFYGLVVLVLSGILGVGIVILTKIDKEESYVKPEETKTTSRPDLAPTTPPIIPDNPQNQLNILPPLPVDPRTDPHRYKEFKQYADLLKNSLNYSFDPCNNFYEYVCKSYEPTEEEDPYSVLINVLKQKGNEKYHEKAREIFEKCKSKDVEFNKTEYWHELFEYLGRNEFGLASFPLISKNKRNDADSIGKTIGLFAQEFDLQTLLPLKIRPNWKHTHILEGSHKTPYLLYIQPVELEKEYDLLNTSKGDFISGNIRKMLNILGKGKVKDKNIKKAVEEYNQFEEFSAKLLKDIRKTPKQYNLFNITAAKKWRFISFSGFFERFLKFKYHRRLEDSEFEFAIEYPEIVDKIEVYFKSKAPEVLPNYLYTRLILKLRKYLDDNIASGQSERECARLVADVLPDVTNRLYLDSTFPRLNVRKTLLDKLDWLVSGTVNTLKRRVETLDWMERAAKDKALRKLNYLNKIIGYPRRILDDNELNNQVKELHLQPNLTIAQFEEELRLYKLSQEYKALDIKDAVDVNRMDSMLDSSKPVYDPELNRLSLPISLIKTIKYDEYKPTSINIGQLGTEIATELMKIFDDQGIQHDEFGELNDWMDLNSKKGYEKTKKCLKDQLENIETESGIYFDTNEVVEESLRINGGTQIAYETLNNIQSLYGADPRLPGDLLQHFTHPQLFFISYTQKHCKINGEKPVNGKLKSLTNFHRVLEVLQNSPSFASAFNCQTGSDYSPPKTCTVWNSGPDRNSQSYPENPELITNIRKGRTMESEEYKEISRRVLQNINVDKEPCNDFLNYACDHNSKDTIDDNAEEFMEIAALASLKRRYGSNDVLRIGISHFEGCQVNRFITNNPIDELLEYINKTSDNWPNFVDPISGYSTLKPDSISKVSHYLANSLDIDTFYRIQVKLDPNRAYNNAYVIHLLEPRFIFDPTITTLLDGPRFTQEYIQIALEVVATYFKDQIEDRDRKEMKIALQQNIIRVIEYERKMMTQVMELRKEKEIKYFTLDELDKKYPTFNVKGYIRQMELVEAKDNQALKAILRNPNLKIVVDNLKVIDFLYKSLEKANRNGVSIQDPLNYIYLKIFHRLQYHLEASLRPYSRLMDNFLSIPLAPAISRNSDVDTKDYYCMRQVQALYPESYAAAVIRGIYRTEDEFLKAKMSVGQITEYIVDGFLQDIDSITWFSTEIKQNAAKKLQNLIKSIGGSDDLMKNIATPRERNWKNEIRRVRQQEVSLLSFVGDPHRLPYNDISFVYSTIHSLADVDRNSIFLPIKFMTPPYYNPGYPTEWTFAQMGSEIGNLISQNFGIEGIKRDRVGNLDNWMNEEGWNHIKNMTTQIEKQILSNGMYATSLDRVFGRSLGLRMALKGFELWKSKHGSPGIWPDRLLYKYTSNQLLYLSYAQRHCRLAKDPIFTFNELLLILQNNLGFKDAFNCPNSLYAPENAIEIWDSEIKGQVETTGLPYPPPQLNIPENNKSESKKYKECGKIFEDSIDTSVNPCEDFYQYSCGNYKETSPFNVLEANNKVGLIKELRSSVQNEPVKALKYEKQIFQQCVKHLIDFEYLNKDGKIMTEIIEKLEKAVDIRFPLKYKEDYKIEITPEKIGKALGYLAGTESINVLVTPQIYTNMRFPDKGYTVYLLADRLLLSYYIANGDPEDEIAGRVSDDIIRYLNVVRTDTEGIREKIMEQAKSFIQIEKIIMESKINEPIDQRNMANKYATITLREYKEKYANSINIASYLEGFVNHSPEAIPKVTSDDFEIGLLQPNDFLNFTKAFETILSNPTITSDNIANYIFYSVLVFNSKAYLPPATNVLHITSRHPTEIVNKIAWKRKDPEEENIVNTECGDEWINNIASEDEISQIEDACFTFTIDMFVEATNKMFVKTVKKDDNTIEKERLEVAKMTDSIVIGFKNMLNQLEWLDKQSKSEALSKTDLLVKNYMFANLTGDDKLFEEYYKALEFKDDDSFPVIVRKTVRFNSDKVAADLGKDVYDRYLTGLIHRANAWYKGPSNSITLPLGILQQPFYDPEWPSSVNFGAIGVIAGHELTHGFDDKGVQTDSIGRLRTWMTKKTQESFNDMAKCVIDQYGKYCFDKDNCVNGTKTQGENIADNGGIRAAYDAYQREVEMNGQDPSLPSPMIGQFSHDQLFFLSFARMWCHKPYNGREIPSKLKDVHSPGEFRTLGTLQNFPAFKKAFSCPATSTYAPSEFCSVWITDITPTLKQPTPIPSYEP